MTSSNVRSNVRATTSFSILAGLRSNNSWNEDCFWVTSVEGKITTTMKYMFVSVRQLGTAVIYKPGDCESNNEELEHRSSAYAVVNIYF